MKAVIQTRYGGPEVLGLATTQKPSPAAREILVAIHATTVNRTDTAFRSATPFLLRFFSGLTRPRSKIPGTEYAGVVEAVGEGVTEFRVGDRVFGRTQDEDPGAHAEYLCVDISSPVAHQPSGVSHEIAAAISDGPLLANAFLARVDLETNSRVLVNGGTGSIGSAAVQLAKARGAHVTAVCKGSAAELIRSLGADDIIDYESEDFTQCGRTFDIVFDAVGKSSMRRCRPLLGDGGYYASTELGFACINPLLALRTALIGGKIKVLFPIPTYTKEKVLAVKELVEQGKYRPLVDRTFVLDEVVDAHRYVDAGEKVGNVVLQVRR